MAGGKRAAPKPRDPDGLIECSWPVSCRVPIGPDWVSGVYLARLTGSSDGKQSFIPFVVREPPAAARWALGARHLDPALGQHLAGLQQLGREEPLRLQQLRRRASRVSFDRPYATSREAGRGAGAGEFLSVTHASLPAGWEYPFVRWIEKEGYDVAYATNLDLHENPLLPRKRRALLVVGHDEYWTRLMRTTWRARGTTASISDLRGQRVLLAGSVRAFELGHSGPDPLLRQAGGPGSSRRHGARPGSHRPVPEPASAASRGLAGGHDDERRGRAGRLHAAQRSARPLGVREHRDRAGTTRSVRGLLGYEVDRSFARTRHSRDGRRRSSPCSRARGSSP